MQRVCWILAGTAAFGLIVWTSRPGLPDGLIPPEGSYDVEILRDSWGVPHVFGRRDADVAYGLAWAHAEDDFATIQGALLATRGELAAVFGRDAAPNDYMVHLLRIQEVVEEAYPRLNADVREICEAYADGLNHYAALHPDRAIPRLYPARGRDVVAGFVHKTPLFFGLDKTLQELFEEERRQRVSRRPETVLSETVQGSNALAVSPRRTADGGTYLAVNSHQPWDGPVAWYEVHLRSDEGWDMVGGLFPGAPVVLHGHNRHLGWAHTVNRPDLLDVYLLEIDPENPDRYRYDGEWRTLEKRTAPIEVKLWGPLRWTFEREVLWSIYGPALRRPHGTYALRFAGYGDARHLEQWFHMNKARTFDEWRAAMAIQSVPMFNTVYADREGNIEYVYNGKIPRRAEGYDWDRTLPGDTSETLWSEYLPFDALPRVTNPESGFVQNCNNTPFKSTTGVANPAPGGFPPSLGIETEMTNRGLRALEQIGGDPSITFEEFLEYKYDTAYSSSSEMASLVERVLALPVPDDPLLREALEVLRRWDLDSDADNLRTALPVLAFGRYFVGRFEPPAEDTEILDVLAEAARTLKEHHGGLEVPWGTVNRLRRGDVDLPLSGAPEVLHAIYGEVTEDGRLVGNAGESYILVAAWDAAGQVSSRSIHVYGSATLEESSPHYADQSPLFARRELKPVWMDEAEIRRNLERASRPGD